MSIIHIGANYFINSEMIRYLRPTMDRFDGCGSEYRTTLIFSENHKVYTEQPPEEIAAKIQAAGTPLADSVWRLSETCAEQRKLIDDAAQTILELQDHIKLMRAELAALKEDR